MSGGPSRTTRIASIAAAVLLVFGVQVGTGATNAGIAFFFSVPIGLAAWWFGPRVGLLVVAICLLLYAVNDAIHPVSEFGLAIALRAVFFLAVAALAGWVGQRLRTLEHSAEELEAIRAALTPADLPDVPGVDAAAAFVPSELGVSGDFYLLTNGPDGSTVAVVGDVVGHGPAAARLATFIRARFAAFAANTSDPAELLTLVNGAMADHPGHARQLVSAICVRLGPGDADIYWARAGHPPPLWLPELAEIPAGGSTFLLGAEENLQLDNTVDTLSAGEGLIIYTDGATDVRRGREMLGLEGLRGLLAPLSGFSARVIAAEIERAILAWADRPIRDDLCLMVLKPERG